MKTYNGFVPPCGVFCGGCSRYEKGACPGAEVHCREHPCKGIYVCCLEKKGHRLCHECKSFPCRRVRDLSASWREYYGQDLIENQERLRELGEEAWLRAWNGQLRDESEPDQE